MKNRVAGLLLMLPMSGLLAQPLFLWPGRPPRGTMLREAKPLDCSRLRAIAFHVRNGNNEAISLSLEVKIPAEQ